MKYFVDKDRKQLIEIIAGEQVTVQVQGHVLRAKMGNAFSTTRNQDFERFIKHQNLEKGNYILVKISDNVGVTPEILHPN